MAKSRKKTSASRAQKADQPGNTNSAQKMGKPQEKQKTEVTSEPMKAPAAEAPAAETQAAPQAADAAPQAQASETQKPVKKSRPAKEKIFREKSIERLESPEKLNDYLRVTSASVWIVLAVVILLLIGVCIWGVLGRIDSTAPAAVVSQDGETVCLVPASALEGVVACRTVNVQGERYDLEPSVLEPEVISETTDVYILLAGQLTTGDVVYPVTMTQSLPEGIYQGRVVTETLSPMSLFFN